MKRIESKTIHATAERRKLSNSFIEPLESRIAPASVVSSFHDPNGDQIVGQRPYQGDDNADFQSRWAA
jgi:hypothetical protein